MDKRSEGRPGQRNIFLIAGVLGIIMLGVVLLINNFSADSGDQNRQDNNTYQFSAYQPGDLYAHKAQYLGDASNISNLVSKLPLGEYKKEIALATAKQPYGLTVHYVFTNADIYTNLIDVTLRDNALIIFALIKNVEQIDFNIAGDTAGLSKQLSYQYIRAEVQQDYQQDLWACSKDIKVFSEFLNNLAFKLLVFPEQYTPAMSSTPGIRMAAEYRSPVGKVRYAADHGALLTWEASTGQLSKGVKSIDLPAGSAVYWSPISAQGPANGAEGSKITATVYDPRGDKVAEKLVTIRYDGAVYLVQPAPGVVIGVQRQVLELSNLEQAVSAAILDQGKGYLNGECNTEGHVILDTEERAGAVKAYTVASVGWFGFENGVFTKISGSGAIPTVMTFSRNKNGTYSLLAYQEPVDGSGYTESLKKLFPAQLHKQVLTTQDSYSDLARQQEEQAALYLKGLGRAVQVRAGFVAKKLPKLDVEASNKLFAEFTKDNAFLNSCPYWLGTREQIEDGVRYIYATSQGKTSAGHDLIIFKKTKTDGTLVQEYKYAIIGSEPQLIK